MVVELVSTVTVNVEIRYDVTELLEVKLNVKVNPFR